MQSYGAVILFRIREYFQFIAFSLTLPPIKLQLLKKTKAGSWVERWNDLTHIKTYIHDFQRSYATKRMSLSQRGSTNYQEKGKKEKNNWKKKFF